jgi:PTS system nitrogen regulatory IIA component
MQLATLTSPELIFPNLDCLDRTSLLRELAKRITEEREVGDAESLYRKLIEREELSSTGIGEGVAIPHCKMDGLSGVVLAIARVKRGVLFAARDEKPVQLFFCVVSPSAEPALHLQCLAAISSWLQVKHHGEELLRLEDKDSMYTLLQKEST